MTPQLTALLREARKRAGSVKALAGILKLSRQRTADLLAGRGPYGLSARGCLRLAVSEGLDAIDVLRKAGHDEEADLLEQLQVLANSGGRSRLDAFQMWMLTVGVRKIAPRDQKLVRAFIERLEEPPTPPPVRLPRKKRP